MYYKNQNNLVVLFIFFYFSLIMLLYIILILLIAILFFFTYLKLSAPFWSKQPVYHYYDLHYWFEDPKIINNELPKFNKFINFVNIKTNDFTDMSMNNIVDLIRNNFLDEDNIKYKPQENNIIPYLKSHNEPTYVSTYIEDNNLVGCMTTRPLNIYLNAIKFRIYYVDSLVVKHGYRKKGIAPQIIQTHEYHQRHRNRNIQCSLFKREDTLTDIVPLVKYDVIGFHLDKFKFKKIHPVFKILKINKQNLDIVYDYLKTHIIQKFDCVIIADMNNIAELIETNNIIMYVILFKKEIISLYVFQNTCVYHNNKKGIQLIASTINDKKYYEIYEQVFYQILCKFKADYQNLFIDYNSDNHILISMIRKDARVYPFLTSNSAYYFYNYLHKSFKPNNVFIIT